MASTSKIRRLGPTINREAIAALLGVSCPEDPHVKKAAICLEKDVYALQKVSKVDASFIEGYDRQANVCHNALQYPEGIRALHWLLELFEPDGHFATCLEGEDYYLTTTRVWVVRLTGQQRPPKAAVAVQGRYCLCMLRVR